MEKSLYKSRVGLEILLPTLGILAAVGAVMAWDGVWVGLGLVALTAAFVVYVFTGFRYRIGGGVLEISCGRLYGQTVPIADIRSVRPTRNPMSAPAASLDRLEIRYGRWGAVMISPERREAFVAELLEMNPAIEVLEKQPKRAAC